MSSTEAAIRVATSLSQREIDEWSLVLHAARIPCQVEQGEHGLELWVRASDLGSAHTALEAYQREAVASEPAPPRVEYGPTPAGWLLAGSLLMLFALQGPLDLTDAGAADARAILRGEVWRAITALTLHADAGHVLANAASFALFGTLLFRSVGPGLGACLLLVSGAGGNLLNAWLQGPGHQSLGASTALFGAIGLLSGLQGAARWRWRRRRSGAWLPLAAGLALLAMLGMGGVRTDVLAHLLGLMVGAPLGLLTGLALTRPPARATQLLLVGASVASIAAAWAAARPWA